MFFDDHKKASTIIRGKRSAKGVRESDPTPMKPEIVKNEDGSMDGKHVAMQDFLSAHQEGSPLKMSQALENWHDIHANKPEPSANEADKES